MHLKDSYYDCVIHLAAQSAIGKQFWVSYGSQRYLNANPSVQCFCNTTRFDLIFYKSLKVSVTLLLLRLSSFCLLACFI